METTRMANPTTRRLLTVALLGSVAAGGLYAGCIIPGEYEVNFLCGFRWDGEATDAHGEASGQSTPVFDGGEWVVENTCFSEAQHELLHEGDDAECHLETSSAGCGNATGCVWVPSFSINGRTTSVCLYDDDDYQDVFRDLATAIATRCEDVADAANIEPYPCEELSANACRTASAYCDWTGGQCVFVDDTCTNAAAKTDPITSNEECFLPAGECDAAPGGTGGVGTGEESLPDPSTVITHVTGNTYEVDEDFFALMLDPLNQALLADDDAHFTMASGGGWLLNDVDAGSFAYELGFQDDDKLIELNDDGLWTVESTIAALIEHKDATSFDIKLKRGGSFYHFYYDLVAF